MQIHLTHQASVIHDELHDLIEQLSAYSQRPGANIPAIKKRIDLYQRIMSVMEQIPQEINRRYVDGLDAGRKRGNVETCKHGNKETIRSIHNLNTYAKWSDHY